MKSIKKQLIILTTIFTMIVSYALPFASPASAEEDYITVAEAIANNSGTATVKGYIVGYTKGTNNYQFEGPFASNQNTNFAIADSPTERDPAKIMPVQLTTGVRATTNLYNNPQNLGREIIITGSLEAYFTVPGLKNPTAVSFVGDNPPEEPPFEGIEGLSIAQIQGDGHESPYKEQNVKGVGGVVTYVVDASNFYIQSVTPDDNPKTSEGILVYKPTHGMRVGDKVSVNGLVKEWVLNGYSDKLTTDLAMTEINAQNGFVNKLESNHELPEAIVIGRDVFPPTEVIDNDSFAEFDPEEDGIDFYESLEGMRVALDRPIAIAPQKYGEVPVILEQIEGKSYTSEGGILLTEHNANPERMHLMINTNFVAKTGDQFDGTVTGVVSYSYSNFKILVEMDTLPGLIEGNAVRGVSSFIEEEDKVTIASYNIENFTALNQTKTDAIAESIIHNLKSPDIIGLIEVQDNNGTTDNGTTDASANYEGLIASIVAQGGPTYAWTDIAPVNNQDGGAPGGNIRNGFLYNPERVQLAPGEKGDSTTAVGYEDGSLTLNPGRVDPTNSAFTSSRKPLAAQFTFNGDDVIVIANHFNSKRGDYPVFGKRQPAVLSSEVQRLEIATVLNDFVSDIKSKNADAKVVVLGDLNDFEFSAPLEKLKGDVLTNLIESVPTAERYTYNYQGNAQVLDHILVSNNLAAGTGEEIVHLNSPFMEQHGRVSDHDAVLAQLDLSYKELGPFELSIIHTNDNHAHVEQFPRLITAVNEIRGDKENSLLVDAGDVFSGTLYFRQYQGLADLEFMNLLNYDAMTFGNHEFDKDSNILANFVTQMNFPMVSANVNVTNDSELGPLFKNEIGDPGEGGSIYPAIVKEIDGEKVGIFGLTTEDTTFLANPSDDIVFENAITKAQETVDWLQSEGINKIVALSHLGFSPDVELAEQVSGIDVIVGGHSHTKLDQPVVVGEEKPTVIVQANEYLKFIGVLDVTFDNEGVVTAYNGELLDVSTFAEDEAAKARVDELKQPIEELKQQVVGSTSVFLNGERTDVRSIETNLGNLITDAMVAKANESVPTTIGFQNGGGIRASIPEGDITLGDVLTVMPFENMLVTLDLTGAEIWEALEHSVSEPGQGKFSQVSGLRFNYDLLKPAYNRVWSVEVKTATGYEPIDLTKTYSVATNAFVADGGDGYTVFKKAKDEGRIKELFVVDFEVLSEYFVANSPVSPTIEGRIIEGVQPVEEPTTPNKKEEKEREKEEKRAEKEQEKAEKELEKKQKKEEKQAEKEERKNHLIQP